MPRHEENVQRISASDSTFQNTVRITGGANITVGTDASGVSIVGAAGGGGGAFTGGMSNLGNTSGTTGTVNSQMLVVGGPNITVSQSINANSATLSISGSTQTQQTQNIIRQIVASDLTITSGSLTLSGFGDVTVNTAAGPVIRISAPVQTGTQFSGGISNIGNTAGDTGTIAGRLVFAGGNNVTLSGSTNGVSETITISGPNTVAQTGTQFSGGMSNIGNTSGDTGVGAARLVLAGGNNITLSQSSNGESRTVTISAPNLGAGAFSGGVSNLGNTAGSTGVTGTRYVLVGTDNITLSQSTDANGGTVSISGGAGGGGGVRQGFITNMNQWATAAAVMAVAGNTTHSTNLFFPIQPFGSLSAKSFRFAFSRSSGTSLVASVRINVYTRNVSTLSSISSTSGSFSITTSADWQSIGLYEITGLSNLELTPRSDGYWIGMRLDVTTGALSVLGQHSVSIRPRHLFTHGATQSVTPRHAVPGQGFFSSNALPATANITSIVGENSTGQVPWMLITEIPIA